MRHVVLKKFGGTRDGQDFLYIPGMEVDATSWKHEQLLVEQRKIAPIPNRAPTNKELARPGTQVARLAAHLKPPTSRKQADKENN